MEPNEYPGYLLFFAALGLIGVVLGAGFKLGGYLVSALLW